VHENYAARPHPEYVVLDIGGDLGALIVYTEPAMHGREVEISPGQEDSQRSHKDVLERGERGRVAFTAVFDRLPGGAYTLWVDGVARARGVEVTAGEVTEQDWTAVAPSVAA
jgi:hypothetical protein